MKSKPVHKKGKKRPLVEETSSPLKPDQKSEDVVESKRNRKKMKNDNNIQNGDSVSNTKALQKVAKQKKKQKKVKDKSDNTVKLPAVKIKTNIDKKIKPTLAESKEKTLNASKEKKQEHLKNKQLTREMNKVISRTRRYKASNSVVDLTILKNKVSEIRSREVLSKTAKKRIAVLLRKIRVLEKEKANQSETVEEDDKEDKQQANVSAEKKQKSTVKDKRKTKKEHGKNKKAKVNKEEDNDEDQSDIEEAEMDDIMQEDIDVDSVEDEEDEENEEMTVVEVKKKKKKATDKSSGAPKKKETKKKQHILFVGNLPHDTTSNELGQHFQSKVDTVISVHIPIKPGTKKLCNFAYVELSNNADCEKALALNHTFLRNKKINVQYAASKNPNKVDSVAKNKKLQVLCKTGKFTGVKGKKKLSKKGKQKFAGSKV